MATPSVNVLSLCTGAGGLDLGVRLAVPTARTVGYVEIEAYAAAILAARMEEKALDDAPLWSDLRTFDGYPWRGKVSLIVAGYPCQPFSVAGRQRGADDPRHLWPSVERIIREVRPDAVFLENVSNHLQLGGYEVARSLQALGYETAATLVEAQEVGAPHKRQRLFILGVVHASVPCAARFPAFRGHGRQTTAGAGGPSLLHVADTGLPNDEGRGGHASLASGGGALSEPAGSSSALGDTLCRRGQAGHVCQRRDAHEGRTGCATPGSGGDVADTGCECLQRRAIGGGVAGEEGAREGEGLQRERGRHATGHGGSGLADAEHAGRLERSARDDDDGRDARWRYVDGRDTGLPLFPPGRDLNAWRQILAIDASVEPSVCGVVDGLETRVDRLRLCGNGVVPQQAAFAFRELWSALMEDES